MKFTTMFLALFAASVSAEEQCCNACENEGEEKYYSIDKLHGECTNPTKEFDRNYNIAHKFLFVLQIMDLFFLF